MNILLTGGTGFIGSYVAMELVGRGHRITIPARNPAIVPALAKTPGVEIVPGDITDQGLIEGLMPGKDACIHVALNFSRKTGWEVLLDDTLPSVFLSDIAAKANVAHFIYTSSTSVNDSLYMGVGGSSTEEQIKIARTTTKQRPDTFYGATKAASENFLMAQSYLSTMRVNIIRPGYTFGNPVIAGGKTEGDLRFRDIVRKALGNQPITITKNDGTQFIFAGDLAKLYGAILHSEVNRKTYYGMGKTFFSWHAITLEAIKRCGSESEVSLEDKGCSDDRTWDVSDMKDDFALEWLEPHVWQKITDHLDYFIELESGNRSPCYAGDHK